MSSYYCCILYFIRFHGPGNLNTKVLSFVITSDFHRAPHTSHYTQAWAHVAGSPRPEKEQIPRKAQSSKKLRPPLKIRGELCCHVWCDVGVCARISTFHVILFSFLIQLFRVVLMVGSALRYGSWDFSERALLAEYKVGVSHDCIP